MSRIFAPEFRGTIRGQSGERAPENAFAKLMTRKIILCVVAFSAFALHCAVFPASAEARYFQALPKSCAAMFALRDPDGRTHELAALRGKPVLVHFFATWCEPCKAEFATLRDFAGKRANQVSVLAVNVGEVPGRVRKFLAETPVNFPVVLDADRAVSKAWNVEGLPATVVLDAELTPRLAVTGDLDWANPKVGDEIERALATPPNDQKPSPPDEKKPNQADDNALGSSNHDCKQT